MSQQYLVFDIETTPVNWDTLSESQQEYLLRYAETDEEIEQRKFEMALNPLTASVVCIGLQLMEQQSDGSWKEIKRAAFSTKPGYDSDEIQEITLESGFPCYIISEEKVLLDFWAILDKYKGASLISFNGRGFDAPFLMLRSAIHGIRPRRNIMSRYKIQLCNAC
jgi:DNA polymerase elongation subunit (family B)